jgi:hypothetical protein
MTTIIYTAVRELTGLTPENGSATIEIGITDLQSTRSTIKDVQRSKGGARETLYHRSDVTYTITFEPVNGYKKQQFREFIASTESGQSFSIYLYGDESLPVTVVRDDDASTESIFMGIGTDERDYVQASIVVMKQ